MNKGDYVRINEGYLGIIDELNPNDSVCHSIKCIDGYFLIQENQIKKSSPNIIDLIEVGDYVNGLKVANIEDNVITMVGLLMRLGQDDIKSIVTKEQFEEMEYKI